MAKCEVCKNDRPTRTAVVAGKYYKDICRGCISGRDDEVSGGAASYERRRGYEDNAQDAIQPYDANGKPRVEFLRMYPDTAEKMFDKQTLDELKRKI